VTSLVLAARPLEFFFAQYRRVWRGTAVSSVITPVVYLLAFGFGLGRLVDRTTDLPDGITYLEFVAPGLLAATAMQIATFEGSWPVLSAIKWSRQYHAMLATPLRVFDVLAGHQAFIAFRMVMTSTVYLAAIAAFGAVNSPLGILAIPVTVLVGLAFAAPIAAWGAYTQTDQSFVAIFRFGILPMFLFSGTFFPIERLPGILEVVARLTPLWHGVDLCRQLTLGDVDPASASVHVAYLLGFASLGLVAAYFSYRRRLVV
jgi:lipooligosaccharide transport system permease protein